MSGWDQTLTMNAEDRREGTDGKAPDPASSNLDADGPAGTGAEDGKAGQTASAKPDLAPNLAKIRNKRGPALGFVLAIPAGVALWVVAIYLLTKLV